MTETPNFIPACPRCGFAVTVDLTHYRDDCSEVEGWSCTNPKCQASWDTNGFVTFGGFAALDT